LSDFLLKAPGFRVKPGMTTKVTGLLTQNTIYAFDVRRKFYAYRLLKNAQMQGARNPVE
jgi:hypothetical protein